MIKEFVFLYNTDYNPMSSRTASEYVRGQSSKMYTNINELISDVKSVPDLEGEQVNLYSYDYLLPYKVLLERLADMAQGYFDPNAKKSSEKKLIPNEIITAVSDIIRKKLPKNLSETLQHCENPEALDTYGRLLLASDSNTFTEIIYSNFNQGTPVALTEKQMKKFSESCKKYLENPLECEDLKYDKNFPKLTFFPRTVERDQLEDTLKNINVNVTTDEVLNYIYPQSEKFSDDQKRKMIYDRAFIEKNNEILKYCSNYKLGLIDSDVRSKRENPSIFLEYDSEKQEYVFDDIDIKDEAIKCVKREKKIKYREIYLDGLKDKKPKFDVISFFGEHLDEIDDFLAQNYLLEKENNPETELYNFDKLNQIVKEIVKREKQQKKASKVGKSFIYNIIKGLRVKEFNEGVKGVKDLNNSRTKDNVLEPQGPNRDE